MQEVTLHGSMQFIHNITTTQHFMFSREYNKQLMWVQIVNVYEFFYKCKI